MLLSEGAQAVINTTLIIKYIQAKVYNYSINMYAQLKPVTDALLLCYYIYIFFLDSINLTLSHSESESSR